MYKRPLVEVYKALFLGFLLYIPHTCGFSDSDLLNSL